MTSYRIFLFKKFEGKLEVNSYRPFSVLKICCKIWKKKHGKPLVQLSKNLYLIFNHQLIFRLKNCFCWCISKTHCQSQFRKVKSSITIIFIVLKTLLMLKKFCFKNNSYLQLRPLILNYLKVVSDQMLFEVINANPSKCSPVSCGVPQNSVLRPLIFLIYFWHAFRFQITGYISLFLLKVNIGYTEAKLCVARQARKLQKAALESEIIKGRNKPQIIILFGMCRIQTRDLKIWSLTFSHLLHGPLKVY